MNEPTDDDQRRAQIAELRAAGRSVRQIAEQLGISKTTVSRLSQTERDTPGEQWDTPTEARDTPDQPQDGPADTGPTTPAGYTPADLRAQAEQLRRRATQARRDGPQIVAEAQARAQQLSGQAVTDDRQAETLDRQALDLERPRLPAGRRISGYAG